MQEQPRYATHLCIASREATPNLTPALHHGFRPRRVVMVTSPEMGDSVKRQARVLKRHGILLERLPVPDAFDIDAVRTEVDAWLEREDCSEVVLNATGGTKPMSLGAYEVFLSRDLPVFYVHPQEDRLLWVSPAQREGFALQNTLTLTDFLEAYGATVVGVAGEERVPEAMRDLTAELVERFEAYQHCLPTLNWLAQSAQGTLKVPMQGLDKPGMADLIDAFEKAGALRLRDRHLTFTDESARFLVNGGWLEVHALAALHHLGTRINLQDVRQGVQVRFTVKGKDVNNELDVAFLADNRPHIIECKTRSLKAMKRAGGDGVNEALYRLDAIADVASGANGRVMYLSYAELGEKVLSRAALLGVAVCHGAQLRNLEQHLVGWVTGRG